MNSLYHFTCHHGHAALGESGVVAPGRDLPGGVDVGTNRFAWFTDIPDPAREWVGLTSHGLSCDRLAYRYRVTDATDVDPWHLHRSAAWFATELESAHHAFPRHWFVSLLPVPVVLDQPKQVAA